MEFELQTDLDIIPQKIEFNAEELKTQLAEKLSYYESLVVTESTIKDAKADRAALNKLKKNMETRRMEVKSACNTPYDNFKRQYDEVLAMIQKPIDSIDQQLKAFEEKRKDEKLQIITDFWNQNVGECKDYISFKQIFNPKWLNATFSMGDVHNAIMAVFIKVEDDVKAIRELNSDFETEALEEYAKTNNMAAALNKISRLEERRSNEQKRQDAALTAPEPKALTSPVDTMPIGAPSPVSPEPATVSTAFEPQLITFDLRVTATPLQIRGLKAYLENNNIKYGRVPEKE